MDLQKIHFIGSGGSGISALTYYYHQQGMTVTGSDQASNPNTDRLKKDGIQIYSGHEADHLEEMVDLVIYSEAIDRSSNPEFLKAKELGIACQSYFEALGELSASKKTIVVAGTHGKTTTTAMLGQALVELGEDPMVIVGSRVPFFEDRNIHVGSSDWLVVEGCEYRRSFLNLKPFGVILLNCEWEHVDYYKTEADYVKAFEELVAMLPQDGFLIYNQLDKNAQKVSKMAGAKTMGVDWNEANEIKLAIPGDFNRLNAAHALMAAKEMGHAEVETLNALSHFNGTARRMEIKGEKTGVLVVDDYAHHPTEIKATLNALKEKHSDRRLICVFQPHQYSRTIELLDEFKTSFGEVDRLIIPNIYEARDSEEDKAKMSAEKLCQEIPGAVWGGGLEKTNSILKAELKSGDLLVTMGAGDVYQLGEQFLLEN